MKMWTRLTAVAALLAWSLMILTTSSSYAGDGKTLFVQYKCNSCHTISAAGIQKVKGDDDDGGTKPPDLSHVGKDVNAQWIQGFLQKTETLKGKKHKKTWKGSDADLQAISAWLASLK